MENHDEKQTLLPQNYPPTKSTNSDRQDQQASGSRSSLSHGKFTSCLVLSTFAALCGVLNCSYNMVIMNTPEAYILAFMNQSLQRYVAQPSESSLTILWSVSISIYYLSGAVGAFTFGYIANRLGRRNGLFVCQVGSLVSCIFFAIAVPTDMFEMLIVGHVLVGWSGGACAGLVPLYLTEIAPINLRGAIGCLSQVGMVSGGLLGQLLSLDYLLGTPSRWPILLCLASLPNVLSFALLPFCPESPGYLLIERQDEAEARNALRRLRARKDVTGELDQIRHENDLQKSSEKWSIVRLLSTSELRLPLALICAANAAQQLSGVCALVCYSEEVFTSANIPASKAQYAVLGIGIVRLVFTLVAVVLVEKVGRRLLLLISSGSVTVLDALICVSLLFESAAPWLAYLSVVSIVVFFVAFSIGYGCIPQFLGAELFAVGPRAPAMSLAILINWFLCFAVVTLFPMMQLGIGAYSFLIFAGFGAVFFVFLFLKLPETKLKTLSQVYEQLYGSPSKS